MVLMKRFVLPHLEAGQTQLLHLVQQNQVEKKQAKPRAVNVSAPLDMPAQEQLQVHQFPIS